MVSIIHVVILSLLIVVNLRPISNQAFQVIDQIFGIDFAIWPCALIKK